MPRRYWCVRLNGGRYVEEARRGGFIAVGWNELGGLSWMLPLSEKEAKRDGGKT